MLVANGIVLSISVSNLEDFFVENKGMSAIHDNGSGSIEIVSQTGALKIPLDTPILEKERMSY